MRITNLTFTKDYQEVAEALAGMVTNPVITERKDEHECTIVEVEGDFEQFVLQDMETWAAHLKFEIRDNRILGESDRQARALLAESLPGFGGTLFARSVAWVYRRIQVETRVQTITEKCVDGRVIERKESDWEAVTTYEWEDITLAWSEKMLPPSKW